MEKGGDLAAQEELCLIGGGSTVLSALCLGAWKKIDFAGGGIQRVETSHSSPGKPWPQNVIAGKGKKGPAGVGEGKTR